MLPRRTRYPSWLKPYLDADWVETRRLGKNHFVWREIVLPFGTMGFVFGVGSMMFLLDYSFHDLFTMRGAILVGMVSVVSLLVTYHEGVMEWNARERSFHEQ